MVYFGIKFYLKEIAIFKLQYLFPSKILGILNMYNFCEISCN